MEKRTAQFISSIVLNTKTRFLSPQAFTLTEILIVIALIGVLAAAILVSGDYFSQVNKGRDAKRKSDLAMFQVKMEDYYTDNNRYPDSSLMDECRVPLSGYIDLIPCDPLGNPYFYEVDSVNGQWYRIYTALDYNQDPAIVAVGCINGCGPSGNVAFDYGVSSSNVGLEFGTPVCSGGAPPTCQNAIAYCGELGTCCPGSNYTMTCDASGEWCCP